MPTLPTNFAVLFKLCYLAQPDLKLDFLLLQPHKYHCAQCSIVLFIKETMLSVLYALGTSVKDHD